MYHSPEALTASVEAVDCGSFPIAARRLHRSQSMISTAVTNLGADLGVILFDRATWQPMLTLRGEQVLSCVKAILAASERLDELAVPLAGETGPRLTFALSDTLHPDMLGDLLVQFGRHFPHTESECSIGEDENVTDLLQKARAQIGLIEVRDRYPIDIGGTRLSLQTVIDIYVAPDHPLATQGRVVWDKLRSWRELRLSTFLVSTIEPATSQVWSTLNYLSLFSMTVRGFGQYILPHVLVAEFAPQGGPVAFDIPGWPRVISVDLLRNKKVPPGATGSWLRGHLQRHKR